MEQITLKKPSFVRFENPAVNVNFTYDNVYLSGGICQICSGAKVLFFVDGAPALQFWESALDDVRNCGGVIMKNDRLVERVRAANG